MRGRTTIKRPSQTVAMILILAIILTGCVSSTKRLPVYEVKDVDHYQYIRIKDGLAVAIQPLIDPKEIEKYFGVDLLFDDILPVLVIAENRSSSSSFVLSKNNFLLKNGEKVTSKTFDSNEVATKKELEAKALTTIALPLMLIGVIILPLMFVSLAITNAGNNGLAEVNEIRYNFAVNELQTVTLSPGEATRGFVYLQLPKSADSTEQWVVSCETLELNSKAVNSFEFPFKWDSKKVRLIRTYDYYKNK